MRIAIYLLAMLLLLPYLVLTTGFLVLSHAIAGGTLLAFFEALLRTAMWMIPWGLLAFGLAYAALIAIATNDRWRWAGACCLFVVAVSCVAVILALGSGPLEPGQLIFLLPCLLAAAGSLWVTVIELRERAARRGLPAAVAR